MFLLGNLILSNDGIVATMHFPQLPLSRKALILQLCSGTSTAGMDVEQDQPLEAVSSGR
ncbi:hypothetical protein PSEUDO9AG_50161 [Pseudomonas sp. 9Ag]|nr:hypothetical protein PSEUDO9AG_50161 [Pseudomonas sp. 9Ag]